jgi:hypothetical protein
VRRYFRIVLGGIEALEGARSMRAGLWDEVGLANMARDARESTWVAVRLGLLPFPTRVF